jgi:hypothetical protein
VLIAAAPVRAGWSAISRSLVLLSDFLVGAFSDISPSRSASVFVVIVYFIPGGFAPRIEQFYGIRPCAATREGARRRSARQQFRPTRSADKGTGTKCATSPAASPFTPDAPHHWVGPRPWSATAWPAAEAV